MASTYPPNASLPQSAALVSRWLCDETSGNRADIVGSNTLTDHNSTGSNPGLATSTSSYLKSAKFLKASSNYLGITDAAQTGLEPTSFTVSAWVRPISNTTDKGIVSKMPTSGAGSGYFRLMLNHSDGDVFELDIYDGSAEKVGVSTTVASNGTWYHVVGVFVASTRVTMYINGSKEDSKTSGVPGAIPNDAYEFDVGALVGGTTSFWDGDIQDVRFRNVGLTDAEVMLEHQAYFSKGLFPIF